MKINNTLSFSYNVAPSGNGWRIYTHPGGYLADVTPFWISDLKKSDKILRNIFLQRRKQVK